MSDLLPGMAPDPARYGQSAIGRLAKPFPDPGLVVRQAFIDIDGAVAAHSRIASGQGQPGDEEILEAARDLPLPWLPEEIETPKLRGEIWSWFDDVVHWLNTEYLWVITPTGIPVCWPRHPEIIHELAWLAAQRFLARTSLNPVPIKDWHQYELPGFLGRVREQLSAGNGCDRGHVAAPRAANDERYHTRVSIDFREQAFREDLAASRPRI